MKPLGEISVQKKPSQADRGKSSETAFKKALDRVKDTRPAVWTRLPDARAGSKQRAIADFMLWTSDGLPRNYVFEVKELAMSLRLPCGNVAPHQITKLRELEDLGVDAWFFVYAVSHQTWFAQKASEVPILASGSHDLTQWNKVETDLEKFILSI